MCKNPEIIHITGGMTMKSGAVVPPYSICCENQEPVARNGHGQPQWGLPPGAHLPLRISGATHFKELLLPVRAVAEENALHLLIETGSQANNRLVANGWRSRTLPLNVPAGSVVVYG